MSRLENTAAFHTDVRSLVEYYQWRNDKEGFREYYENCEEAYELNDDGVKVLSKLVKSKELELLKTKKNNNEGGKGKKMCRAITELIEDGRNEGRILEYITIKREDGKSEETIRENIIVRFHLTKESADQYLKAKLRPKNGCGTDAI